MIIEKVNYDFSTISMPSLAEAKQILKKIKQPGNGTVVLLVPEAPDKTASGTMIGKAITEKVQTAIENEGLLLVKMCDSLKELAQTKFLKEGDFVYLNPQQGAYGKLKYSKDNKSYIMIMCHYSAIITTLDKPNYKPEFS